MPNSEIWTQSLPLISTDRFSHYACHDVASAKAGRSRPRGSIREPASYIRQNRGIKAGFLVQIVTG